MCGWHPFAHGVPSVVPMAGQEVCKVLGEGATGVACMHVRLLDFRAVVQRLQVGKAGSRHSASAGAIRVMNKGSVRVLQWRSVARWLEAHLDTERACGVDIPRRVDRHGVEGCKAAE